MASSRWTYPLALLVLVAIFGFIAYQIADRQGPNLGAPPNAKAPNGTVQPKTPEELRLQAWTDAERQRAVAILLQAALERGTTVPSWAVALRDNPQALVAGMKFLRWSKDEGAPRQRGLAGLLLLAIDEEGEFPDLLASCENLEHKIRQGQRNNLISHMVTTPSRRYTLEMIAALSKAKPVDVSFWLEALKPAGDPRAVPAVIERFAGEEFVKQGTTYAQMETVLLWLQAVHPEAPGMLVKRLVATGNAPLIQKAVGQGLVLSVPLPLEALLKADIPETSQAQAAMIAALKPHEGSPEVAERVKAILAIAKSGSGIEQLTLEEEWKRKRPDPKDPQKGLARCVDFVLFESPNPRSALTWEMALGYLRLFSRSQVEAAFRAREAHKDERIREGARLASAFFRDEFDTLTAMVDGDIERLMKTGARAAASFEPLVKWQQARVLDWPQGNSPSGWLSQLTQEQMPIPALLYLICSWSAEEVIKILPDKKEIQSEFGLQNVTLLKAYLEAVANASKFASANGKVPAGDTIGTALEKARSELGSILFQGSSKERKLVDLPTPFREGEPAADMKTEQSF